MKRSQKCNDLVALGEESCAKRARSDDIGSSSDMRRTQEMLNSVGFSDRNSSDLPKDSSKYFNHHDIQSSISVLSLNDVSISFEGDRASSSRNVLPDKLRKNDLSYHVAQSDHRQLDNFISAAFVIWLAFPRSFGVLVSHEQYCQLWKERMKVDILVTPSFLRCDWWGYQFTLWIFWWWPVIVIDLDRMLVGAEHPASFEYFWVEQNENVMAIRNGSSLFLIFNVRVKNVSFLDADELNCFNFLAALRIVKRMWR